MEKRRLGPSDIQVSVLGFGCWPIVGGFNWGPQDKMDSIEALRAAFDAGINFFDTAEGYGKGDSELLVGEALHDVRDKVVIATKVLPAHCEPSVVRVACEESLRRLRTDYIDIYQLHWPARGVPVADTLGELDRLREAGKIRAIGVSNFGTHDLAEALAVNHAVAANQLAYNLLFRAIEYEIFPLCRKENVAVTCYCPIMQGLLTGKFLSADQVPVDRARTRHYSSTRELTTHGEPGAEKETFDAVRGIVVLASQLGMTPVELALSWLIAREGVASAIVGARNAEQVNRNVKATVLTLSPGIHADLARITDPLKEKLGANADMWLSDSRIR